MMTNIIRKLYHNKLISKIFPTTVSLLQKELADCDTVLDLGCGPDSPIQYCKNIKYSVGVELHKPYLDASKKKKIHSKYLREKIEDLKFPEKCFDAVIMVEVLEHLSKIDGQKIILQIEKWAKKKIIISTPNGYVRQTSLDGNDYQKHLSGWTVSEFKKRNFKVKGLSGLKFLRQEVNSITMGDDITTSIRLRPKLFWFIIATISEMITYHLPSLSFETFNVKIIDVELKRKPTLYHVVICSAVMHLIKHITFHRYKSIYGKFITVKDHKNVQASGLGNITGLYLGEIVREIKRTKKVNKILLDGDDNSCKGMVLSMGNSNRAKIYTTGINGNFDYIWNFEDDPPKNMGKYDLIISQAMIEHLINPYKHVHDLSKLLNPKGRLVIHSVMPGYDYHRYPIDSLRFYPDWFQEVGDRLGLKILRKYIRNSHLVYCYEKS